MDLMKHVLNFYFRFRLFCQNYMLYIVLLFVVLSVICVLFSIAALLTSVPGKSAETSNFTVQVYLNQEIERQYEKLTEDKRRENDEFMRNRLRLQLSVDRNHAHFENMKPAAKLVGTEKENSEQCAKGTTMDPIKNWLQGKEHYEANGFMRFGMKEYNGRLLVPLTGTYAIYSQVEYNYTKDARCMTDPMTDQSDYTVIWHEIYRYNVLEGHEHVLVSARTHVVLGPSGSGEIVGSYIFTIGDLRAGDELAVRVNSINHTTHNFFGLNHI